jgi:hypothetical protein
VEARGGAGGGGAGDAALSSALSSLAPALSAEAHLMRDMATGALLPPTFREPVSGDAYHAQVYLQSHSSLF